MANVDRFRLNGRFRARLTETGATIVWPHVGAPLILSGEEASLLLAFGSGRSLDEAAAKADCRVRPLAGQLCELFCKAGLLEVVETADGRVPVREHLATAKFGEQGADWLAFAYPSDGPTTFASQRIDQVIRWLAKKPTPTTRLLDLGCGGGHLVTACAELGYVTHGLDSSPEMVAACQQRIDLLPPDSRARASVELGDVSLYKAQVPASAVTALGVVAWLDNPLAIFETARKSMANGGLFILDCVNRHICDEGPLPVEVPGDGDIGQRHLLLASRFSHTAHAGMFRAYGDALISVGRRLKEQLEHPSVDASATGGSESRPSHERTLSMADVETFARRTAFTVIDVVGVGDVRSMWNYVLPASLAALINEPLNRLRPLPVSALWSSGVMYLLLAS